MAFDIPSGPQLTNAVLSDMTDEDLYKLATAVSMELRTVEMLYGDGEISSDELMWVRDDAKTVQDEFERRGDTVQVREFGNVLERMVLRPEFAGLFDEATKQRARENLAGE